MDSRESVTHLSPAPPAAMQGADPPSTTESRIREYTTIGIRARQATGDLNRGNPLLSYHATVVQLGLAPSFPKTRPVRVETLNSLVLRAISVPSERSRAPAGLAV
jgi:hypothetical protein